MKDILIIVQMNLKKGQYTFAMGLKKIDSSEYRVGNRYSKSWTYPDDQYFTNTKLEFFK